MAAVVEAETLRDLANGQGGGGEQFLRAVNPHFRDILVQTHTRRPADQPVDVIRMEVKLLLQAFPWDRLGDVQLDIGENRVGLRAKLRTGFPTKNTMCLNEQFPDQSFLHHVIATRMLCFLSKHLFDYFFKIRSFFDVQTVCKKRSTVRGRLLWRVEDKENIRVPRVLG